MFVRAYLYITGRFRIPMERSLFSIRPSVCRCNSKTAKWIFT